MSVQTGVNRVAQALRWLGRGGGAICLLVVLAATAAAATGNEKAWLGAAMFLVIGVVWWGALEIVGWIVAGFASG